MVDAGSNTWTNCGLSQSTQGLMSHYCYSCSDAILVLFPWGKKKRRKRHPDKILEYEMQTNVKWSEKSFHLQPRKKKKEKKIYNNLTTPAKLRFLMKSTCKAHAEEQWRDPRIFLLLNCLQTFAMILSKQQHGRIMKTGYNKQNK